MPTLLERAKDAVQQRIFSVAGTDTQSPPFCLVALSGGADSVALFRIALLLQKEGKLRLGAVHVHHGIRGAQADRDADFCKTLCAQFEVPFFFYQVDVPAFAKAQGVGMETAARELRYGAFEQICSQQGDPWVLTAHHQDDQVETVFLRLLRGTSPKGLCGIAAKRDRYLRPFLSFTHQDLIDLCTTLAQPYLEDSTNQDISLPRNYLRHQVLPHFRQLSPSFGNTLQRILSLQKEEQDFLDALLEEYHPNLQKETLQRIPPVLLRRYLSQYCMEQGMPPLEQKHLQTLSDQISTWKTGSACSLPGGYCAFLEKNTLSFSSQKRARTKCVLPPLPLQFGWTSLPNGSAFYWTDDFEIAQKIPNIYKFDTSAILNSATIVHDLFCRTREEADSLKQGGMTRKLKTLFAKTELTKFQKEELPFVCDQKGIVWIPFLGVEDRVKQQPNAFSACYLFYALVDPRRKDGEEA